MRPSSRHRAFSIVASLREMSDQERHAIQMKTILRLTCLTYASMFCVAIHADDIPVRELGKSVDVDAKDPAANVKAAVPRPGYEYVLGRLVIEPTPGSSPPSFFVSGRVISDNTGLGSERIAIFIGQEDQAPELAAMTNADGDFKFRLWIKVYDRNPRVNIPPDFSGYLYVGGDPSLTHRNVLRLMSGYAVRYKMTDLAKRNKLELPIAAESNDRAPPQLEKK